MVLLHICLLKNNRRRSLPLTSAGFMILLYLSTIQDFAKQRR